jgi:NDP-sugar pyrophosphorylase family protein
VFPVLAEQGKLFGHTFEDIWIDIGKPEDYLKANKVMLEANKEKLLETDVVSGKIIEPVMFDSGVTLGENSKIGPYTVLGRGTVLGNNVRLENSVVFPEATILDSASITGAVIGEGATVGEGAIVSQGCVIGDYVTIGDNVKLDKNVTVCHSKVVNMNVKESNHLI